MSKINELSSGMQQFHDIADNYIHKDFSYQTYSDVKDFLFLLDEETPMKPTELETGKYSCDSCAMAFTVKDLKYRFLSHTYCDICGQKIDWSEDDEQ